MCAQHCVFFLRGAEVQSFISVADCSRGNTQISVSLFNLQLLIGLFFLKD